MEKQVGEILLFRDQNKKKLILSFLSSDESILSTYYVTDFSIKDNSIKFISQVSTENDYYELKITLKRRLYSQDKIGLKVKVTNMHKIIDVDTNLINEKFFLENDTTFFQIKSFLLPDENDALFDSKC
jgi:hypothetical protein